MFGLGTLARMGAARFRRNPVTSVALFLLIALTATTASSGVGTAATVIGATGRLFSDAIAPDFVQMHVGDIDEKRLEEFAATRPEIVDFQATTVLTLDNEDLAFDGVSDESRAGVMEVLLATQSDRFDLLLGSDNRVLELAAGEIAVPVFYMQEYGLVVGDTVTMRVGAQQSTFVVVDLLRDAQMNPSIVNSKRFLISDVDWEALQPALPAQHLITFRLDTSDLTGFAAAYREAGLPVNGPAIDGSLLRLVSSLTDGVVAALTLALSLVLLVISFLCLRLVVLTTLENERRRIGILRALGFSADQVIGAALAGYALIAIVGSAVGLMAAQPLKSLLTAPVTLYAGALPDTTPTLIAMIAACLLTAFLTVGFSALLLRRIRKRTPIAVLRGETPRRRRKRHRVSPPFRGGPVAAWLAVRSRLSRPGGALLLFVIITVATMLSLLPARITQTISAPSFVTTMGVGASDLRAFLPGATTHAEVAALMDDLKARPDIDKLVASASYRTTAASDHAGRQDLAVEVIDASTFPITYSTGNAAISHDEITLSTLAAEALGVQCGDEIVLDWDGAKQTLIVSGTYQDITNGGRSAKTPLLPGISQEPIWRAVAADIRPGSDAQQVALELGRDHPGATITDLDRFVDQTFGSTVRQLNVATGMASIFGLALVLVITTLQGRLEIARDHRGLRTLRLIGYSATEVRATLVLRTVLVAGVAIPVGAVLTELLGPTLLGAILASLGGSTTSLIPPGVATIVIPLSAAVAAAGATLLSTFPLTRPLAD